MSGDERRVKHGVWLKNGRVLSIEQVIEHAVAADRAGWDGVFVSDSIWEGWSDPWTVLAAIAARTEHVRLGTWITPLPTKVPWELAHSLASLDQISNGRVLLGTGLGLKHHYETFGGEYDPKALGRKYDEALEVMTGLWSGDEFSYDGEFFKLDGAKLPVTPVQQPRIPIVVDLHSPGATERHPELAQDLGVTWFMTTSNHEGVLSPTPTIEQIQQGPPW